MLAECEGKGWREIRQSCMCLSTGKKRVETGRNGVSQGQDRSADKSSRTEGK